jgi:inosine-uridine nucleoside N-ribohydrolase
MKLNFIRYFSFILFSLSFLMCKNNSSEDNHSEDSNLIPVILDTDANNELDDQHAIAYMLFNSDLFDIKGITVNETFSGLELKKHVEEADRIVNLCDWKNKVPVIPGASGDYHEIIETIDQPEFDGYKAVNFIIERAKEVSNEKLVLIPIGKLTNIALALAKAPEIAKKIKVVWLGSNWPEPGEYNLENDTTAVSPLLENADLELEILPVRYSKPTGTAAVRVSIEDIRKNMAGLGPKVDPISGRHGGLFSCFGDYSVELFVKYGDETRPLFDVCALAVLKNPSWAEKVIVKGASFDGKNWGNLGDVERTIVFWENFDKKSIIEDFYATMKNSTMTPLK